MWELFQTYFFCYKWKHVNCDLQHTFICQCLWSVWLPRYKLIQSALRRWNAVSWTISTLEGSCLSLHGVAPCHRDCSGRPSKYKVWSEDMSCLPELSTKGMRQAAEANEVPKSTFHDRITGKCSLIRVDHQGKVSRGSWANRGEWENGIRTFKGGTSMGTSCTERKR